MSEEYWRPDAEGLERMDRLEGDITRAIWASHCTLYEAATTLAFVLSRVIHKHPKMSVRVTMARDLGAMLMTDALEGGPDAASADTADAVGMLMADEGLTFVEAVERLYRQRMQ